MTQPKFDPKYAPYLFKNKGQDYCLVISKGNSLSLSKCNQSDVNQRWMKIVTPNPRTINMVNFDCGKKAVTAPTRLQYNLGQNEITLKNYDSNSTRQEWSHHEYSPTTMGLMSNSDLGGKCLASYNQGGNWVVGMEECLPLPYNNYKRWSFEPVQDANNDTICPV